LRSASKMIVSSADGSGGVGGDAVTLFGDDAPDFGGEGVSARTLAGNERAVGELRDGSKEGCGESSTDKEAKAVSRSLE
jgi:hypothetical protein